MSPLVPARNLLKVWLLFAGVCSLLGYVGWVLGGFGVSSIFVFCGLLLGAAIYWYADRVTMGMLGARELPAAESPALHTTLERLSLRAGIVKPRLYVIPLGPPLGLSAGRGPAGSALAVTQALVTLPSPAELEGVLAHEVAHIRSRDVLVQTMAVVIATIIVESSRIGGWFERSLLFVLGPIAAAFVHLLLSPKREFEADRYAASLCESPHGLADALIRLDQASELVAFRASPAAEPLFTIDPFEDAGLAALFGTHPSVGERVQRLRELDPDWRSKLRAA